MRAADLVDTLLESDDLSAQDYLDSGRESGLVDALSANTANTFYHRTLKYKSDKSRPLECRRNGRTKYWKTRPNEFRIPVKYGMYEYFYIDNSNAHEWSTVPNPTSAP